MKQDNWTLVHTSTNTPAVVGETITNFRGEQRVLSGGRPPQHDASSGRVWLAHPNGEYFPNVFDMKWIQGELQ
jgi:hypothetical protein